MDSDAFVQFAPIKNPTDILSFSLILFKILSRCSHYFNFDGVATSSLPTGKNFLIYVCGSSSESSKLFLLLATFSLLITDYLLVTSPLTVFMVIVVLLPFMLNLFSNLSKMKVHYLKLSKSAYVFRVSPESTALIIMTLHTYWAPPCQYSMMHMLLLCQLFSPRLSHCYTGIEYFQLSFWHSYRV